ncbi:hypothetical protein FPE01S_01_15630 [Flavihumibacter petaseus NBRC 106054]|uniref:Uncharacterized protein n=2 Tax=Flavihumibacter TaxID=1004301 RepID=A0A0E9MYG4_9BACT|nr:hypothetical protein FPE01S_01_15630 [Flavihumibacter petaseus NBRC 106054]
MITFALYVYFRLFFREFGLNLIEEVAYFAGFNLLGLSLLMFFFILAEYGSNKVFRLEMNRRAKNFRPGRSWLPLLLAIMVAFGSCKHKTIAGFKKDAGTGVFTKYANLEPEDVLIVMNGEVINHNTVPLGQDFILINKNVQGFEVRDNKISIGCSLQIRDEQGKLIMDEADLFKGKSEFDPTDAGLLKCHVNTGQPMEWQKQYRVSVRFWDKYGDGKIENDFTIDIQDEG